MPTESVKDTLRSFGVASAPIVPPLTSGLVAMMLRTGLELVSIVVSESCVVETRLEKQ